MLSERSPHPYKMFFPSRPHHKDGKTVHHVRSAMSLLCALPCTVNATLQGKSKLSEHPCKEGAEGEKGK